MDVSQPAVPVDDIEIEGGTPTSAPVVPPPVAVEAAQEADESAEALSADPGDEDDQLPVVAKPRNSVQARIDKSVAAQRQAERERDEYKARIDAYERSRSAPVSDEKREPQYTRPKPTEDEIGTTFKTYPEFVEALQDWKLEQRDVAQAQQNARRAHFERHEQLAKGFVERIQKTEETNPDFWKTISPEIVNLRTSGAFEPSQLNKARVAANRGNPDAINLMTEIAVADSIFDSEYSSELMAHLSANSKDFQRLFTLPPDKLYREMGRLEAMVMRPAAATSGPAPKTVISSAPAPIKPVGTTASTASADPLSDDLDIDEHIKVMNAKERKARR